MAWTPWKMMANRHAWFDDHTLRVPPVCYQLGLGEPSSSDDPQVMYVGYGKSECDVTAAYARGEPKLCAIIQPKLDSGLNLYWRCRGAPTVEGAKRIQEELLAEGSYPWNEAT